MKLSIALGISTLALVRAAAWVTNIENVGPSALKHEELHAELQLPPKLLAGQWTLTIRMPGLDVHANRPHSVTSKASGALRCGPMAPMIGAPNGAPHEAYGRVQRCWTL